MIVRRKEVCAEVEACTVILKAAQSRRWVVVRMVRSLCGSTDCFGNIDMLKRAFVLPQVGDRNSGRRVHQTSCCASMQLNLGNTSSGAPSTSAIEYTVLAHTLTRIRCPSHSPTAATAKQQPGPQTITATTGKRQRSRALLYPVLPQLRNRSAISQLPRFRTGSRVVSAHALHGTAFLACLLHCTIACLLHCIDAFIYAMAFLAAFLAAIASLPAAFRCHICRTSRHCTRI